MTLPASGPISLNNVNVELGLSGTTLISLNQASVRTLAGVPSGAISMNSLYGKSNRLTVNLVISADSQNRNIVAGGGGLPYIAGITDLIITVNPGIYVYSVSAGVPGLQISGFASTDTITLVNQGFIIGLGGNGGTVGAGTAGGNAINLIGAGVFTINNTNGSAYIAGGGGGGGGYGGGGGAGGGNGGGAGGASGGFGGGLGGSGSNGGVNFNYTGGGGGGRTLPGVGGIRLPDGAGGGAGGAGGSAIFGGGDSAFGGAGGSANNPGADGFGSIDPGGGGGGGWGAAGGNGINPGGAGGKAVYLNGATVTFVSGDTSRVYGAVGS